MTKDLNKGINPLGSNPIKYNHLNLPTEIYFSATKKNNYIYSATGEKLQKIITSGTVVSTVDYLGGFQYLKAKAAAAVVMQFFPTAEGYVNLDSGVYKYVFNYLDHLGNVRLSYTKNEATGLAVIMEENHYYPSGLKHTNYNTTVMKLRGSAVQVSLTNPYKYKYNGCEYQEELGLNLYDMDLRDYDPAIGRWTGIDPIVHFDQSPYMAMNGNPVVFADPSGADGVVYGMAGQSAWSNPYPRGHDSYGNTSYRSGTESPQAEFGSWGESAPRKGGRLNITLEWESLDLNTNINFSKHGIHVSSDNEVGLPGFVLPTLTINKGERITRGMLENHYNINSPYVHVGRDVLKAFAGGDKMLVILQ